MILNEGEIIYDQCNGKGTIQHGIICKKCGGEGKLDWVSNTMGRNGILVWGQKTLRSYNGKIVINSDKGISGTTYPIGTTSKPVNNIHDAKIIAKERGYDIK